MQKTDFDNSFANLLARIVEEESADEVAALLASNGLPHRDLRLQESMYIRYDDSRGTLVGAGGLEFYGDSALLRSVVVGERFRGKSIGKMIVTELLDRARAMSIRKVYLLTETARDFFSRFGFLDENREDAPAALRASSEFSTVCPVSAVFMVYKL